MNRAERRASGQRGPAFRHYAEDARPRYVRRHTSAELASLIAFGRPMTRRDRKAMSRISRHDERRGTIGE